MAQCRQNLLQASPANKKKQMADELRQETECGTVAGRKRILGNSERHGDLPGKAEETDITSR